MSPHQRKADRKAERKINRLLMLLFPAVGLIYALVSYVISVVTYRAPDPGAPPGPARWSLLDFDRIFFAAVILFIAERVYHLSFSHEDHSSVKEGRADPEFKKPLIENLYSSYVKRFIFDRIQGISDQPGLSIRHPFLAIESYKSFWQFLAEKQAELKKIGAPPMKVYAVHACAMKVWTEHQFSHDIIEAHRLFHENGGQVCRILIGSDDKPDDATLKAAARLIDAGVDMRYWGFYKGGAVMGYDGSWDFLRVSPEDISVVWRSITPFEVVQEVFYGETLHYDGHDLRLIWDEIFRRSDKIAIPGDQRVTEGVTA